MQRLKKKYSYNETKILAMKYCTYRERCHSEVRERLFQYGLNETEVNQMLAELVEQKYLNEERFAKTFCRGKFLHNHWGKVKITLELKKRNISPYCIKIGLTEINDEEYNKQLKSLMKTQYKKIKGGNDFVVKGKLAKHLMSKGYEGDIVWSIIRETYD